MKSYEVYPSEMTTFKDRVSGTTVHQLTNQYCDSWHAYFTHNGFWDNGKQLLFSSHRRNTTDLYSIMLESGEIRRLTNFEVGDHTPTGFVNDVNQARPEIYYSRDQKWYAYDLVNLESRLLYEKPQGFNLADGGLVSSDGKYLYISIIEDLSDRIYMNLSASYVGFKEIFEAKPFCQMMRVNTETGESEVIWEDHCWLGHLNPSPTQPHLMTFCHEGPWDLVDNRMWLLDTNTLQATALRERVVPGEAIGHEYWYKDGLRIGYQVTTPGKGSFNGVIDWDGKNQYEAPCVKYPGADHIHSVDFNLIVSDSGNSIKLYRYNGTDFDEARILCMHDGSVFRGNHHPHPKIMDNGKQVLYNSDSTRYCQIYIADIPEDVTSLPTIKQ